MNFSSFYNLLERPFIYKLSQSIFAPGADRMLTAALRRVAQQCGTSGKIVDIGCGPSSWLWKIGVYPIGLDISHEYSLAYTTNGSPGVTGSAFELPFSNDVFDGVWCIGVLHHLTDEQAKGTICEMLRICRPGGYVVVMDAVLPKSLLRRPVASLIRRMDRGKFMRSWPELKTLFPIEYNWTTRRFTYAATGLEMFETITRKSLSNH